MEHKDRVFAMLQNIAPLMVECGNKTIKECVSAGADPDKVTVRGKSIYENYSDYAVEWAEAMVKEFENRYE